MRISDWSSDVCSSDLYEITRADLEQAARVAGIAIRRGDAVLVRTGWGRHWDDGKTYLDFEGGMPGPGVEAIDWLCRSEEHTSELQSLMRISYAVFCLKKKTHKQNTNHTTIHIHTQQAQLYLLD